MIMPRIFNKSTETWTETIELAELGKKKLHNAIN